MKAGNQDFMPKIYTTKPIMVSHYTQMEKELFPEPRLKPQVAKPVHVEFSVQTEPMAEPKPKVIIQ